MKPITILYRAAYLMLHQCAALEIFSFAHSKHKLFLLLQAV